jgi:hypothetical protein
VPAKSVFLADFLDLKGHATTRDPANMNQTWLAARRSVAGRPRNSRVALAIHVMAATPLISASTLAGAIGMSIKKSGILPDRFCTYAVAVEVTHRSA